MLVGILFGAVIGGAIVGLIYQYRIGLLRID